MAIFLAVAVFERLRTVRALRRANQDLSQRIAERSQQSQVADQRLLRRGQVIAELTSAQYLETEPLERVIKRIAEGAAREIGVERTSIWRYNAERTQIVCEDLFELATGRHSGGAKATLARANYPSYFAAIDSKDIVAASDARTDPRTVEFTESYLNPLGIGAMLDTPIMLAGKVEGVVCLEHVGAVREWNAEDVIFAVALSNVVALALEISTRRWVQEDFDRRTRQFQMATAVAGVFPWYWDVSTDRTIWWTNEAPLLGPSPASGYADFRQMVHPEDRQAFLTAGRASLASLGDYAIEFRLNRTDGETRWVHARGKGYLDPQSGMPRMMGVMVDINDRKLAEVELQNAKLMAQSANRVKTEFLSRMSHELRTPLNGILGFSELMHSTLADDGQREHAKIIHESGQHLLELVDDVLDLSDIQEGHMQLAFAEHGLASLVNEVMSAHQRAAERKNLRMLLEMNADLPTAIYTDAGRLKQILNNLMHNAVKYSERGEIRLVVKPEDEGIAFQIDDQGPGIAPENLARLFDAFEQYGQFATRQHDGMGIGLGLAKEFANMLGAKIGVESRLGEGSTFTLWHPLRGKAQSLA